jgi:hypothetical protein
MHRAKQIFLLAVLALSFLPLLGLLLNVKVSANLRTENRVLAAAPTFSWRSVRDATYFAHFENYFNDHFGFRDVVIARKQSFDWNVLQRVRPDLIRGRDGYIFYKFIAERYMPKLYASFPREYMIEVLMGLREELARRGITMIVVHYPNKPLIYHDKLPSYWQIEADTAQLPFYQGIEELRRRGVPVLSFARDFFALRAREEVFTPAEENHCTPQAYFHSLRQILQTLSDINHVPVNLPDDFPKVYSARIEGGKGYRNAHHLNTAYEQAVPWTAGEEDGPGRGGRFFYTNAQGVLPSTTVYTDSFFEILAGQFWPLLLPHFQELRMDYTTFSPRSLTPRTRVVMLVFSDQNLEAHIHHYKKMLDELKALPLPASVSRDAQRSASAPRSAARRG